MAELEALLHDLANLDAENDLDGLRRVREQIVAEHSGSEAAVEALYKLGLDALFRQRQMEAAMDKFQQAAKRKHPFWSPAARTSLGLCYFHQKRTQKALFELRRVAYPETPSPHSVTALSFIEAIYAEEQNAQEMLKVRKERINQLEKLIAEAKVNHKPAERAYYLYSLALAQRDNGEKRAAEKNLQEAKKLGPDVIGADLYRSIVEQLN